MIRLTIYLLVIVLSVTENNAAFYKRKYYGGGAWRNAFPPQRTDQWNTLYAPKRWYSPAFAKNQYYADDDFPTSYGYDDTGSDEDFIGSCKSLGEFCMSNSWCCDGFVCQIRPGRAGSTGSCVRDIKKH